MCYTSCPLNVQYSINGACISCNVAGCYECAGEGCSQCNTGLLLIGTSLCITNCSTNQVYDSTNKSCQTIITPTNSTTTNTTTNPTTINNTTTVITAAQTQISFIPLPFLIVSVLVFIFMLILHWTHKIFLIPSLEAVFSIFLMLCAGATILVCVFGQYRNA